MVLIIDNYDSFTYNLYQYVAKLGYAVQVVRNDAVTAADVASRSYQAIIISPGPGTPSQAGITKEVIVRCTGRVPILGVCLGHQAIGEVFGGQVVPAPVPVHGKASLIQHCGTGLYRGLPNPLPAGRYHSLMVARDSVPPCLEVTAATADGLVMGLRHRHYPVEGVQFHPESVLTPAGLQLLANFLQEIS